MVDVVTSRDPVKESVKLCLKPLYKEPEAHIFGRERMIGHILASPSRQRLATTPVSTWNLGADIAYMCRRDTSDSCKATDRVSVAQDYTGRCHTA
ncbi:hypothetical protein B296_00024589 [Ensete ventricosum]|uniref:Uncharacterized protein n=1 Tax=Ensete ventricosum TaxID=4639 RepID=A0A427A9X3_ENSVE|nr:hypothetical protein B296_00024589 [Ensete ventricosum]